MQRSARHGAFMMRVQSILAPFASLAAVPVVQAAGKRFREEYPNTFYAHALNIELPPRPTLDKHAHSLDSRDLNGVYRNLETDVCVVGGGFAGLAAALSLTERGKKVSSYHIVLPSLS